MELLWQHGERSARQMLGLVERPLAYTTVMTTLDRLYKKGLLLRRMEDRAYRYAPRWSREEWDQRRARNFFTRFLSGPEPAGRVLISCLVDAVGKEDASLLDELEARVRARRRALRKEGKA